MSNLNTGLLKSIAIKLTRVLYGYYQVNMFGVLDKYIIETVICVAIAYLFYNGFEKFSIKMGQKICMKFVDKKKRQILG